MDDPDFSSRHAAFPLTPMPFGGQCRVADAGASFDWLRQGWAMFMVNPGLWIAATLICLIMAMAVSIVPIIGTLVVPLFVPILAVGMLNFCHTESQGGSMEMSQLFIGFQQKSTPLIMLGLIYMGIGMVLTLILVLFGAASVIGGVGMMGGGGLFLTLIWMLVLSALMTLISVPLAMSFWFAPTLVFLQDMSPVDAIKASFAASLKNWLPFVVFSLICMVLLFFTALSLGLGFLVLLPVLSGAAYASYRDIFVGT
jgi:uncharacterized membrane protein